MQLIISIIAATVGTVIAGARTCPDGPPPLLIGELVLDEVMVRGGDGVVKVVSIDEVVVTDGIAVLSMNPNDEGCASTDDFSSSRDTTFDTSAITVLFLLPVSCPSQKLRNWLNEDSHSREVELVVEAEYLTMQLLHDSRSVENVELEAHNDGDFPELWASSEVTSEEKSSEIWSRI